MKLRKLMAASVATVIAVTGMAVSTSAANLALDEGTAVIGFADADWKVAFWGKEDDTLNWADYCTPAQVTGNGTYTVSIDLSTGYTNDGWIDEETGDLMTLTTANNIGAMGINLASTDKAVGCNITSVKFDGVDFPLIAASFTNDEDGGRRTNIFNQWSAYDATKEDHVTLDADKAAGAVIDVASLGEWTTCEVTFDVYGMANDAAADVPAAETPATDAPAATTEKGSPDTGVEGVAAVAGIAVLAAGAIVLSKKRK